MLDLPTLKMASSANDSSYLQNQNVYLEALARPAVFESGKFDTLLDRRFTNLPTVNGAAVALLGRC